MPVWSYSSQRTVFRSCFSPFIMWAPQVELVLLGLKMLFLAEDLSWPWPIWKWLFPFFAVFQFHLWIFSFVAWTISSNFVLLRDFLVKVLDTLISLHFCLFDYTVLKFFYLNLFYFILFCFYIPIKVFPLLLQVTPHSLLFFCFSSDRAGLPWILTSLGISGCSETSHILFF